MSKSRTTPKKMNPCLRLYQPPVADELQELPAAATPGAPMRTTADKKQVPAKSDGAAEKIKQKIEAAQKKIEGEELSKSKRDGKIVLSLVEIGRLLVELQQHVKKTWSKDVKALGYSPRAASRLQQLGASWWAGNGLLEAVSLDQLPTDVHKLEWLCRLGKEQLAEFLGRTDCKALSRTKAIEAVKEVLGLHKDKEELAPEAVLVKTVEQFVRRLTAKIEDWQQGGSAPQARQQVRGALDHAFEELRQALDSPAAETAGAEDGGEAEPTEEEE
jgi:hypothetical protein